MYERLSVERLKYITGYKFRKSFTGLLGVTCCIAMGVFIFSCAGTMVPNQIYLSKENKSGISKVAVITSISAPKVEYSTATQPSFNNSRPIDLIAAPLSLVIDQWHASSIKQQLDVKKVEEMLTQSFIESLKKGNAFAIVEHITEKSTVSQLPLTGYDAIIRLSVKEISLRRMTGDYVNLYLFVHGQMEKVTSGNVVWDREEFVSSPNPRSIEYYKENGLKDLDVMIKKACTRLASDFIY